MFSFYAFFKMMHNYSIVRFLAIIFISFPFVAVAQPHLAVAGTDNINGSTQYSKKEWVQKGDIRLRWQPLGLINVFDMNVTVGAEYNYAVNKGITFDAGYIFASLYGENGFADNINPASGVILRAGHRWYLGKYSLSMIETEAGLKKATYKSGEQWVGRNVVGGVPAYEELMRITSKKEVYTFNVKYGRRFVFNRNGPMSLELLFGLGIRYRNYYPDLPGDAQNNIENPFVSNPWSYGSSWLPDFPLLVRLTYKL
jgi:hypothetical protein